MSVDEVIGKLFTLRVQAGLDISTRQGSNIIFSARAGNFKLLLSEHKVSVGYIIWANIDRHTYFKFRESRTMPKYEYEWNEGSMSLIVDFVVHPIWRGRLNRQIHMWTREVPQIIFAREGRPVKRITRRK